MNRRALKIKAYRYIAGQLSDMAECMALEEIIEAADDEGIRKIVRDESDKYANRADDMDDRDKKKERNS